MLDIKPGKRTCQRHCLNIFLGASHVPARPFHVLRGGHVLQALSFWKALKVHGREAMDISGDAWQGAQ